MLGLLQADLRRRNGGGGGGGGDSHSSNRDKHDSLFPKPDTHIGVSLVKHFILFVYISLLLNNSFLLSVCLVSNIVA